MSTWRCVPFKNSLLYPYFSNLGAFTAPCYGQTRKRQHSFCCWRTHDCNIPWCRYIHHRRRIYASSHVQPNPVTSKRLHNYCNLSLSSTSPASHFTSVCASLCCTVTSRHHGQAAQLQRWGASKSESSSWSSWSSWASWASWASHSTNSLNSINSTTRSTRTTRLFVHFLAYLYIFFHFQ